MIKNFLFFLLAFALFSCSKTDVDQKVPEGFLKEVKIYGMQGVTTFEYFYEGNKISKITYNSGSTRFFYTENLITEIQYYNSNSAIAAKENLVYNSNNEITEILKKDFTSNSAQKEVFIFNSDGSITRNYFWGDLNSQTNAGISINFYFENGEVIKSESTENGVVSQTFYEYDTKFKPLQNVIGAEKFNTVLMSLGEIGAGFLDGNLHNCTRVTYLVNNSNFSDILDFEYTYNSKNMPTFVTAGPMSTISDAPSFQLLYQE